MFILLIAWLCLSVLFCLALAAVAAKAAPALKEQLTSDQEKHSSPRPSLTRSADSSLRTLSSPTVA